MPRIAPLIIVAIPALLVAVAVVAVVGLAGASLLPALLAGVLLGAAMALWLWQRALGSALSALGAEPLSSAAERPRLVNVVEGLCATLGMSQPSLHVVDSSVANSAVVGRSGSGAHLVVTRGLLESLDRLELEAVVARELCRIRYGLDSATVLAGVVGMLGSGSLAERLSATLVDPAPVTEIDIESVRLTRYPPALTSAFEKILYGTARSTALSSTALSTPPSVQHLWLIEPAALTGRPRRQPPLPQRLDTLKEI